MGGGPQIAMLPDGRRLHLQHGPIDLIVEADGAPEEIAGAHRQAIGRFRSVLEELVGELPRLRQPLAADTLSDSFRWGTARRMAEAARMHRGVYVTPMAGVAGAVADEILAAMVEGRRLNRAYVNNGGDIALYLGDGARFAIGLVDRPEGGGSAARFEIDSGMPVRGVATSGWRGRSFSLGFADAVTVLAVNAAAADVAATLIANRVNANDPAVERRPAAELDPDSDLGMMPVTVSVGALAPPVRIAALDAGLAAAEAMRGQGLIYGAALLLDGESRVTGPALMEVPGGPWDGADLRETIGCARSGTVLQ